MGSYFVIQPITDRECRTIGSELICKNADTVGELIASAELDKLTGRGEIHFSLPGDMTAKSIPDRILNEKTVIRIEDSKLLDHMSHSFVSSLKRSGCRIAVSDFGFEPKYFGALDIVDILRVDFRKFADPSVEKVMRIARSFKKSVAAYNIECSEAYDKAVLLECAYLQGSFAVGKLPAGAGRTHGNRDGFFRLMSELMSDETDIEKIKRIISEDPLMSRSIADLANSAYFALRNSVENTDQALAVIGLSELRRWVYMLFFQAQSSGAYDRVVRQAFLRGALCAELSEFADEMPLSRTEAYLMGMLSLSGRLMQLRLDDALTKAAVPDNIRRALTRREGAAGRLFLLVCAYENADWDKTDRLADSLGIPREIISDKYRECLKNVNTSAAQLSRRVNF